MTTVNVNSNGFTSLHNWKQVSCSMAEGQGQHPKLSPNVKNNVEIENHRPPNRIHFPSRLSKVTNFDILLNKDKDRSHCLHCSKTKSSVSTCSTKPSTSSSSCVPISQPSVTPSSSSATTSSSSSSSPPSSSSSSSPCITELRPEIVFLIREHAKTLATLNRITDRLSALESKVESIAHKFDKIKQEKSKSSLKKIDKCESGANYALSDDSGGEFSQSTTETDQDELLSLLDQIAKFSVKIKQTHQVQSDSETFREMVTSLKPRQTKLTNQKLSLQRSYPKCLEKSSPIPLHHTVPPINSQSLSELLFDINHEQFIDNLDLFLNSSDNFSTFKASTSSRSMIPELISSSRGHHQSSRMENSFLKPVSASDNKTKEGFTLRSSLERSKMATKKDVTNLKSSR